MVERRAYPCIKIGILLKTRKKLHVGTGTRKCGNGTKSVLVFCYFGVLVPIVYCMWVPVPLCAVPVPLPLQILLLTVALPGASRQRLPSTAMIYICSLETNPYKKCARNSKNLHKHKNMRQSKAPILTQNERKT